MAQPEKSSQQKCSQDSAKLRQEFRKLDVSSEEEVDALKVDLLQERDLPEADGSGPVVDELAEQELAKFTEVGPFEPDRGAESMVPGRDDTSGVLRRHHPNSEIARAEDVVEGNLDEPRDEIRQERKSDEGTAA